MINGLDFSTLGKMPCLIAPQWHVTIYRNDRWLGLFEAGRNALLDCTMLAYTCLPQLSMAWCVSGLGTVPYLIALHWHVSIDRND